MRSGLQTARCCNDSAHLEIALLQKSGLPLFQKQMLKYHLYRSSSVVIRNSNSQTIAKPVHRGSVDAMALERGGSDLSATARKCPGRCPPGD